MVKIETLKCFYKNVLVVSEGQLPQWKEAPCGGEYVPSTNVPPTSYTPILFNAGNVTNDPKSKVRGM
jgi:hypothetical protein